MFLHFAGHLGFNFQLMSNNYYMFGKKHIKEKLLVSKYLINNEKSETVTNINLNTPMQYKHFI